MVFKATQVGAERRKYIIRHSHGICIQNEQLKVESFDLLALIGKGVIVLVLHLN